LGYPLGRRVCCERLRRVTRARKLSTTSEAELVVVLVVLAALVARDHEKPPPESSMKTAPHLATGTGRRSLLCLVMSGIVYVSRQRIDRAAGRDIPLCRGFWGYGPAVTIPVLMKR